MPVKRSGPKKDRAIYEIFLSVYSKAQAHGRGSLFGNGACRRRGQMHDPCEAVFPDLVLHGRGQMSWAVANDGASQWT